MFIFNNQLVELTLESNSFKKTTNFSSDSLKYNINASFLVIQLPDKQTLSYEDLKSDNLYLNILQTEKRGIGDYTYDADDRIAFNIRSLLKKDFCTYIICIPTPETSSELETNYRNNSQFGFDFIIRKEKSLCSNYTYFDKTDDESQKANPVSDFLNTSAELVKLIFCSIYNKIFNIKRISFKMSNNPIVLMKLNYNKNNNFIFKFVIKELLQEKRI